MPRSHMLCSPVQYYGGFTRSSEAEFYTSDPAAGGSESKRRPGPHTAHDVTGTPPAGPTRHPLPVPHSRFPSRRPLSLAGAGRSPPRRAPPRHYYIIPVPRSPRVHRPFAADEARTPSTQNHAHCPAAVTTRSSLESSTQGPRPVRAFGGRRDARALPEPRGRRRKGRMEKYEPVRDIGSGNFGVARLMRNRETRELVAVKCMERGPRVRFLSVCLPPLQIPRYGLFGVRWINHGFSFVCLGWLLRRLTRMSTGRSSTTARCATRTSFGLRRFVEMNFFYPSRHFSFTFLHNKSLPSILIPGNYLEGPG
jgi:hypothetical protein